MIDLIKIRRDLHQIPELGFKEYQTQNYILEILKKYNCKLYKIETGIVALFNNNRKETLVFRFDMDALPIKEISPIEYKSQNDCMHACGHDAHMALGIGLCDHLNTHHQEYPLNIAILFQPSEETFGGSLKILNSKILEIINTKYLIGLHLFPNLEKGLFFTSPVIFGSAREININIYGSNHHVGNKIANEDPLLCASEIIKELSAISNKNTIVHIGKINSGETRNSVASFAKIQGTIRSKKGDSKIVSKISKIIKAKKKRYHLKIVCDTSSFLPKINNNRKLIKQASKLLDFSLLNKTYFQGEDFSLYTEKYPCLYLLFGIGDTPLLHSQDFNFDDSLLNLCLNKLINLLKIN